jgi:hypothetical protein
MNLFPVDTLKQVCLDEHVEYTFKEFRFNRATESLKAFVDLCFLENGKRAKNRIVWITDNAFVRLGSAFELPGGYRDQQFSLTLSATDDVSRSYVHNLNIYSSTTEEAIAALDLLVGLQDSYFKRIQLLYIVRGTICLLRGLT